MAAARALERGAETIQIFASNPRAWHLSRVRPESDELFKLQLTENDIAPLFLHAPYLVNLASASPEFRRKSVGSLAWALDRAEDLAAEGVVVHAGSGDRRLAARAITRLLQRPSGPKLILELTAGGRGAVASHLDEAARLLEAAAGNPRLAFCLDTCHLHAAGYKITEHLAEEIQREIGVDRLALIHANDSRDPRGSKRDRHHHVGKGTIGRQGFRALVGHPYLKEVPLICETPGELPDDRRNIRYLKRLREGR